MKDCEFDEGDKIVGRGWVSCRKGIPIQALWHGKKMDEGTCVVAVEEIIDGEAVLMYPNTMDDPPQRRLKDAAKTTVLWDLEFIEINADKRRKALGT